MSHLHLWLLGPWRAELDGLPLPSLPTRHARLLLARLALSHPQPLDREMLRLELFPHVPAKQAAQHLRTTLYYLRRVLVDLLHADGNAAGLHSDVQVEHDVAAFLAASEPGLPRARLEAAMSLYRGPFLDGDQEGWATLEGQRLYIRYIAVLQQLVTSAQVAGQPAAALEPARRWVTEEPWDEAAHLAMIGALCALGDRAAAEAQIARARSTLRAEWGQAPGEAFQALVRAVARLPASDAPTLDSPPSIPAQPPFPKLEDFEQLPLIGREAELRHLYKLWRLASAGQTQIRVLEGAAGVGKSRLIQELAARVQLRAGVLVLSGSGGNPRPNQIFAALRDALARLSAPARTQVAHACAALDAVTWSVLCRYLPEIQTLLPDRSLLDLPQLERVAEKLRRQTAAVALLDKLVERSKVLLILEDLIGEDDETFALVAELAGGDRPLMVLMTWQAGQKPPSDQLPVLALPPLRRQAVAALLRAAMGHPADSQWVERLYERCAGNPLFLREILHTLRAQNVLRWEAAHGWRLYQNDVGLPDPVTDLLNQRLELLTPSALEMAQLLAVLARPAGETVLSLLWPDVDRRLAMQAELLDQDVLRERRGSLQFSHSWLQDQILARLDSERRVAFHRRIAGVLRKHPAAEPAEQMVHAEAAGHAQEALASALAAGEKALVAGQLGVAERALAIAAGALVDLRMAPTAPQYWPFLRLREQVHALTTRGPEWLQDFAALEAVAAANGRNDWQVEALNRRGRALRERGEHAAAETVLRQAAHLACTSGLLQAEVTARGTLASVLDDRGALPEALRESELAVRCAEASGDEALHVRALATLAYMQMRAGQVTEADALLTPLLDGEVARRDPVLAARLARQLGIVRIATRRYESAFALLREGVRRSQAVGDLYGTLISQTSLFYELTNFGLYSESRPLGEATIALSRKLGGGWQLIALLNSLALSNFYVGELDQAWTGAQEALAIAEQHHLPEYTAACLGTIAEVGMATGRLTEAQQAVERAERLVGDLPHSFVNVSGVAARLWLQLGQVDKARGVAQSALTRINTGLGATAAIEILWEAGCVLQQTGDPTARDVLRQAHERFLDHLLTLPSQAMRQAFIVAKPAHRQLARFCDNPSRCLVYLPVAGAPTGRTLYSDEWMPVVWPVDAPGDRKGNRRVSWRQCQIRRLVQQASAQGAEATVEALADALQVSTRTVLRDLKVLREQGMPIETRGGR